MLRQAQQLLGPLGARGLLQHASGRTLLGEVALQLVGRLVGVRGSQVFRDVEQARDGA